MHMHIKCNIQWVSAYSTRFGQIMFTWNSHASLKEASPSAGKNTKGSFSAMLWADAIHTAGSSCLREINKNPK